MFSKSQRFENKPVGCGADLGAYNPKDVVKPIGGVIPKVDRFIEGKITGSVKSDTESVHSDKSSQIFRTPKAVRRYAATTSASKKSAKKPEFVAISQSKESLTKELLDSKSVEIRNKDSTILEYETQMKEMKHSIRILEDEVEQLKTERYKLTEANFEAMTNGQNSKCLLCEGHNTELLLTVDDYCDTHKELEMLSKQVALLHSEKVTLLNEGLEEKLMWHNQLKLCQEMAEDEITKSHVRMQELQSLLDESNLKQKELSEDHKLSMDAFKSKEESLLEKIQSIENNIVQEKTRENKYVDELKAEIEKLNIDRNRFAFTLETTRQTVEVMGARLLSSEEDMVKLREELAQTKLAKNDLQVNLQQARNDLKNCKAEYNEVLITIVGSKAALEENHQSILEENALCTRTLFAMEEKCTNDVASVKNDLLQQINLFKEQASIRISELEKKLADKNNLLKDLKSQCEDAFHTINECRNIQFVAECQLENKDQEINELATENDRLAGTLAAVDQEKNELQLLLNEFKKLADDRDRKTHFFIKQLQERDEDVEELEEKIRKISHFLEATEYIVKEKDAEIAELTAEVQRISQEIKTYNHIQEEISQSSERYERERLENLKNYEALQSKYQSADKTIAALSDLTKFKDNYVDILKVEVSTLEKKLIESEEHNKSCNEDRLRLQCSNLETELEEMTTKYTDLLGHQNNKQKIKHVIDLKNQNFNLREENEKLTLAIQKQASIIEKLKKDHSDVLKNKSPHASRKQILFGKENSPIGMSPKRAASPRVSTGPLTPLKDLNR